MSRIGRQIYDRTEKPVLYSREPMQGIRTHPRYDDALPFPRSEFDAIPGMQIKRGVVYDGGHATTINPRIHAHIAGIAAMLLAVGVVMHRGAGRGR